MVSATLLIAWATEVAAFFMSRGLALAILAFLQVSPEFAVEAVLAKNAALDPSKLQFVTANFTGANRLLVGAALPVIFLIGRRVLTRQGPVARPPARSSPTTPSRSWPSRSPRCTRWSG